MVFLKDFLHNFKHISDNIKTILIKLLACSLRALVRLRNKTPRTVKLLARPLGKIGRFFLLTVILPTYKIYLDIKKFTNKFYAPQKSRNKIIHPFSRRYLIHLIIIAISFFTIAANLNANEVRRENFGQTSVMAALVTTEDLGEIEEEGPITVAKKITRYLGQTGVESKAKLSEGGEGNEILPTTVAGDSAIVQPILSPTEKELRQRDKIVVYTIQPGDTISEIAEKFGITTNTILWENNLSAYSLVRPGDKLNILPNSGIQHKVVSKETLAGIAKKYSVEVEDIIEANLLASADDIKIGERLMIPGGKKSIPAPTYRFRTFTQPTVAPAPRIASSGLMTWPTTCRRITQYFRYRHSGIDIACSYGQPIYAADAGTVIRAQGGWNGGYGVVVIIDHGGGKQTLYAHNGNLYVTVGETVVKGQAIAAMGNTGRSTGPHVHFEVRTSGVRRNPLYYIK